MRMSGFPTAVAYIAGFNFACLNALTAYLTNVVKISILQLIALRTVSLHSSVALF